MHQLSHAPDSSLSLHPPIEPFDRRMMDVGDGHEIYVEQCGRPDGLPAIVLHGGPGGGCHPSMRRYFDPSVYRIVLFDQRGCGKSRPLARVEANTTWRLVDDIEAIRKALGVEEWVVFGGSWGAALGLIYAMEHPRRVAHLALRGVFTVTRDEIDWFYGGGAGRFWPEKWRRFVDPIPAEERGDMIAAYGRRLFSGDMREETRFAREWTAWEFGLASLKARAGGGWTPPDDHARAFARIENHYFANLGFLERDGYILERAPSLSGVAGTIVQGRYDLICPPVTAQLLADAWPGSELRMVPMAGHALSEPGITAELVDVMDRLGREAGTPPSRG